MTSQRKDLLAALTQIQNHRVHSCHDIMTITGFMTDDEVRAHIESNMKQIAGWADRRAA